MQAVISAERPDTADASALIAELEAELEPLYPCESRHGYSVEKLLREGVAFFIIRAPDTPDAPCAPCAPRAPCAAYATPALAGCGGIQFFRGTDPRGDYGELKRMYVRPAFRGRGYGRLMLEHLAACARTRGVRLLRLETGIHQHAAIALYERTGFRHIGPFGDYRPDPLSVFFEKRLD